MLPSFIYHPDPIATGNVKPSAEICSCCERVRGHICTAFAFSSGLTYDHLCPWCVADGSAADQFRVLFADETSLTAAHLSAQVIEEVTRRTPPYDCFQGSRWLVCCNDACEFHGDATAAELAAFSGTDLDRILADFRWHRHDWDRYLDRYKPGGGVSCYSFICRHCGRRKYHFDGN